MEQKNVTVLINSTQHDIEESPTKQCYSGRYSFLNGKHIIIYEEQDTEAMQTSVVKNLIKLTDSTFSLKKSGAISANMCFEQKKSHRDVYRTPFGSFPMILETKELKISSHTEGLYVFLNYDLHLNNTYISNCTIELKITFS